jgi:hypothetical protein
MKRYLKPVFTMAAFALLATTNVQADTEEKMIIALKTDDFELAQTDVSALAVGEAQTIETDSGKVIDILRTTDGVEIYVDGALLEMSFANEGLHEDHMMKKQVEVNCDSDEECDTSVFVFVGDDADTSDWVTEDVDAEKLHEMHMQGESEGHKVIMIKKHVVIED